MLDFALLNIKEMLNCVYSKKLFCKLDLLNAELEDESKINLREVAKAMIYAKHYHKDQKRESGEPYYTHPFEVAYMVADYLPKTDIIITALLHDTIEDTSLTREEIAIVFGEQVAEQVYDLTRVKAEGVKISSAQMLEELWLHKKHNLLLIKLFDRIHNMKTISAKSPEKIRKTISETVKYFIILATQFELLEVEKILEDICYKNKYIIEEKLRPKNPTISHAYGNIAEYLSLNNINNK